MKFQWSGNRRFNSYSGYIKSVFSERVQKISIDAGFTCPNRDNSKGVGGCTYCNNINFRPGYIKPQISVYNQIQKGIDFFKTKYPRQKYLAYFQSYTNTYEKTEILAKVYEEALSHPDIIGLVISTRPDAVNEEILNYIQQLSKKTYVAVEYGIESTMDATLEKLNRCHTYQDAVEAIVLTKEKGIQTGAHMILGLPGESRHDIVNHAVKLSKLPIQTLKLHQLQINKNTVMYRQFTEHPEWFHLFGIDEYIDIVIDFLERLNPSIIIERFASESPPSQLVAPKWGLKNFEIVDRIDKRLTERNTWQGKLYCK